MDANTNFTEYANSKGFAVHVREDKMNAYLVIRNEAIISEIEVYEFLTELKITNGIQPNIIRGMCRQRIYGYPYLIAFGTPKIDGDGERVRERYPRNYHVDFDIEDNNLDFRELNYARNIRKGSVISDINIDYRGKDGLDIFNQVAKAKVGVPEDKPVKIGKNTHASADGKHIVASLDGNLDWNDKEQAFEVNEIITIDGNVDGHIGNIDFIGGVIVKGNVLDGFNIKAEKDIVINGFVEHSTIISGGNVLIKLGMIGNSQGSIEAKGNVECDFFENVIYVKAGKNIKTNIAINSKLMALDSILMENDDSILIAGEAIANNKIEVHETGIETHTLTKLWVGVDYRNVEVMRKLELDLAKAELHYEEHDKNIEYLEERRQNYKLSQEEKETLSDSKVSLTDYQTEITQLRKQLVGLKDKYNADCMIVIHGTIYPLTMVTCVEQKYLYEYLEVDHKIVLRKLKMKFIGEFNVLPKDNDEELEVDEEGNPIVKEKDNEKEKEKVDPKTIKNEKLEAKKALLKK